MNTHKKSDPGTVPPKGTDPKQNTPPCEENDQCQQDITEAYKAVIDFNKVVISISSAVLAAVIAFLVSQNLEINISNIASPIFLIISFIFCLKGFGQAISAIQKKRPQVISKTYSNYGAYSMLLGITLIGCFDHQKEKKIEEILTTIQNSSTNLKYSLNPAHCSSIELKKNNIYLFKYEFNDSMNILVNYSLDKDKIILIKKSYDSSNY